MALIDYGALLKVNGKFINKNSDLFMSCSDTGYVCKDVEYLDGAKGYIDGNYFVYAGDENFLIAFYKGIFCVVHNNKIIYSDCNSTFISETLYFEGLPTLKIEHLDKELINEYPDPPDEYDIEWYYERYGKKKSQLKLYRLAKSRNRIAYKVRTFRWLATWEYKGKKYEVIFGEGIDTNENVWNDIKYDHYGFTDVEREIINSWFEEDKESEENEESEVN